jgi:hypothetical protein
MLTLAQLARPLRKAFDLQSKPKQLIGVSNKNKIMTQRYLFLYSVLALVMIWILSTGNSPGAMQVQGIDRTGSPFSPATCQTCHSANAFSPSVDIQLLENGLPVTDYTPGDTYTLQVVINAAPQASRFGFQSVALTADANQQAGTFQNPPSGIAIRNSQGRQYPEQSFKSLTDSFTLTWIAPVSGSGAVRFYAAGIAANNNNSSSGDGSANAVLEIAEGNASSIVTYNSLTPLKVVPAVGGISLLSTEQSGMLRVFDMGGRQITEVLVPEGAAHFIPLPQLPPAVYVAHWQSGVQASALKFYYPLQ